MFIRKPFYNDFCFVFIFIFTNSLNKKNNKHIKGYGILIARKNISMMITYDERTKTIDGIGIDGNDKSKLCLLLSDGMDWTNELEHLLLLQEK